MLIDRMLRIVLGMLFIFLILPSFAASQSLRPVSGKVLSNEDRSPVAGASVTVEGTTIGTSTATDGSFRLEIRPGETQTLVISSVGFVRTTVSVGEEEQGPFIVLLTPAAVEGEMVVITASKRPQSLQDVPVSMAVLGAKEIGKRNILAADDALRTVPGVNFQQTQVNIRASSGYSRGVGSRVMLLFDGLPLLSGDTGEITFESLPVPQIERIEVVKGAGSALYGSGALGGVINVLTRPIPEEATAWWKMTGGLYAQPTYDEWKWSSTRRWMNAQAAGGSFRTGPFGAAISVQRVLDDGYREQDWSRRNSFFTKMVYDIPSSGSVTFTSNVYQQRRGDFLWWKGMKQALVPADAQRNASVTSLRINSSVRYRQVINDGLSIDASFSHFRGEWYRDSLAGRRLDGSLSDAFVGEVQATASLPAGQMLTGGFVLTAERVRSDIFGRHDANGGAVYLQDEITFGKETALSLGIRTDKQNVHGALSTVQTSPRVGVRWTPDDAVTLRASAGAGFRAPSIGEIYTSTRNTGSSAIVIPSTGLHPERSISSEIGAVVTVSRAVSVDAAFFRNSYTDLIEPQVKADTARKAVTINFHNITTALITGGEVRVRTQWFDQALAVEGHYSYHWAVDRTTNAFLTFRPRHIAGADAEYDGDGWFAGSEYRYVSRIEAIDENLVDLAPIKDGRQRVPIHIVTLRAGAAMPWSGLPMRCTIALNNVFDYHYNELIGNVSPPRHLLLSFEGTLH